MCISNICTYEDMFNLPVRDLFPPGWRSAARMGEVCVQDSKLPGSLGSGSDSWEWSLCTHPGLSEKKDPSDWWEPLCPQAPHAGGHPSCSHTHLCSSSYIHPSPSLTDLSMACVQTWVWLTGMYRANTMDTFPDLEEFIVVFLLRKPKITGNMIKSLFD